MHYILRCFPIKISGSSELLRKWKQIFDYCFKLLSIDSDKQYTYWTRSFLSICCKHLYCFIDRSVRLSSTTRCHYCGHPSFVKFCNPLPWLQCLSWPNTLIILLFSEHGEPDRGSMMSEYFNRIMITWWIRISNYLCLKCYILVWLFNNFSFQYLWLELKPTFQKIFHST